MTPPLAGIDFELELLRRDEINVSYILALLLTLKATETAEGRTSRKAQAQRQRVVDLIASEIGLRNKRPYLQEFLNEVMPSLPLDADLRKEFDSFWAGKRAGAFAEFCAAEKLDPEGLQKLIAETLFTGKRPLQDRVMSIMIEKPGILRRRARVRFLKVQCHVQVDRESRCCEGSVPGEGRRTAGPGRGQPPGASGRKFDIPWLPEGGRIRPKVEAQIRRFY